jgi:hypothetical protein
MDGTLEEFDNTDMFVVNLERDVSYNLMVFGYSYDKELTLGDPELSLFDENSDWLAYNDDGPNTGTDPLILDFIAPYSGDYFLAVDAFLSDGKGTYQVNVEESPPTATISDDHANDFETNSGLLIDQVGSGTLEIAGDEDVFVINFDENVSYSLAVGGLDSGAGSLADPVFTVFDNFGKVLAQNDDGGVGLDPFIEKFIPTSGGDHFISVFAYDNSIGTYQITAYETKDDHSDYPNSATRLDMESSYPVSVEGYITPNDIDLFVINMEPGKQYEIVVDTAVFVEEQNISPFDSSLNLYSIGADSTQPIKFLDTNDDAQFFDGSYLTFSPETQGDYLLEVESFISNDHGGYNIGVYEYALI